MKTIELSTDILRFEILPDCGGKIRSLVDRRTGREWMWRNPNLPQRLPEYAQNFEKHLDTGGWDEIFPTVVACELDGIAFPDHGDLVSAPWEVTMQRDGHLAMRSTARSIPVTMEREIRLVDGAPEFVLGYTLRNNSVHALPYLVATHPLLVLECGSRLELPEDAVLNVAGTLGAVTVGGVIWVGELNALLGDESGAWAMKIFSEPAALSSVGFRRADGAGIRMSWDPALLPVLGMWVNYGGWTGTGGEAYHNIGIEPGNAPCDALSDAVAAGTSGHLMPGEVRAWEIRVALI